MNNMPVRLADTADDYARLGIQPHKVARFEDGMRTTGVPGDYEWWYFDSHLDDGSKLVVVFYTKPFTAAYGPLAPQITIDLDLPDGRSSQKLLTFDPAQFKASTDGCDVRIGAYHRFSGPLTIRQESSGAAPEDRSETAIWELMYFGHARRPAAGSAS